MDETKVAVEHQHLQTFVIASVGYALGRMTTMPQEVCGLVREYHPALDAQTVRTILRYIDMAPGLGMECDEREWMALKAFLEEREETGWHLNG